MITSKYIINPFRMDDEEEKPKEEPTITGK